MLENKLSFVVEVLVMGETVFGAMERVGISSGETLLH